MTEDVPPRESGRTALVKKAIVLLLVVVVIIIAYTRFRDALSLKSLARQEIQLRTLQQDYPAIIFGAAFLIYVAVTGLSLPGAAVLSLTFAWFFGFTQALVLVSFASTTGATLAFLLSRYLFRDSIQNRFGTRLQSFNQSLEKEGPFFLFTLRLIPAVPFFVINAVMGLTPIRTRTFWWVSQLGMLPGTAVYVYAGSSVPNLQTLVNEGINAVFSPTQLTRILIAFVMLGVFPLIVRFAVKLFSRSKPKVKKEDTPATSNVADASNEEAR